jgi:hypothetical protein
MNRKWLGKWISIWGLVGTGIWLLSLNSCARSQRLVAITVQPGSGTFAAVDPTAFFDFKAFGTYIHPPATVDLTTQVTWQTDNPQVVQVTSAGVVSPNTNCGIAQVFATFHQGSNDVVSNSSTVTVDGPASLGCPQGGVTYNLSVDVTAGAAFGVIVSSPAGINCGPTCSFPFAAGSSVALTPTPLANHSFGTWAGCNNVSGTTCNVIMNSNMTVFASFN